MYMWIFKDNESNVLLNLFNKGKVILLEMCLIKEDLFCMLKYIYFFGENVKVYLL